jgi:hypothetical protein
VDRISAMFATIILVNVGNLLCLYRSALLARSQGKFAKVFLLASPCHTSVRI